MFVVTSTIFHLHNIRSNRRKCNLQIFCIWCFIFTFNVQDKVSVVYVSSICYEFRSAVMHWSIASYHPNTDKINEVYVFNIQKCVFKYFLLCFLPMMACSQNATKSFSYQKQHYQISVICRKVQSVSIIAYY